MRPFLMGQCHEIFRNFLYFMNKPKFHFREDIREISDSKLCKLQCGVEKKWLANTARSQTPC